MIADINEQGRLSIRTETERESELLKQWVTDNAAYSQSFVDCCGNKKCAFSFDLKPTLPPEPEMIDQICAVCNKPFKGTVKIDVCPTCFI
jgi:rubrerythrin